MQKSQVLCADLLSGQDPDVTSRPAGPGVCLFSVVLQAELFGLEVGQNKHDHNVEKNVNEIRAVRE